MLVKQRSEQLESKEGNPSIRACTGKMLASNAQDYPINYGFDIEEDHVIVHVEQAEEVGGQLVVTGGDAADVLQLRGEPHD